MATWMTLPKAHRAVTLPLHWGLLFLMGHAVLMLVFLLLRDSLVSEHPLSKVAYRGEPLAALFNYGSLPLGGVGLLCLACGFWQAFGPGAPALAGSFFLCIAGLATPAVGFFPLPAEQHFPAAIAAYSSVALAVAIFSLYLRFADTSGALLRLAGGLLALISLLTPTALLCGQEGGVLQRTVHLGNLCWLCMVSGLALLEWRQLRTTSGLESTKELLVSGLFTPHSGEPLRTQPAQSRSV
jgi:hypothetical membrane protein